MKENLDETIGCLNFTFGKSYKECKTAKQLNAYFREERNSRCGFHNKSWNCMGNVAGSQLKMKTKETNTDVPVFVGHVSKKPTIQ